MTVAWDLIVWGVVALLVIGVRSLVRGQRPRGDDAGSADAAEHDQGPSDQTPHG